MRRPDRPAAAVAGLALIVLLPGAVGWDTAGHGPLEGGSDAVEEAGFSALVSVRWFDRGRMYETTVEVWAGRGRVRVGGPTEVELDRTGRPILRAERWLRVMVKDAADPDWPDMEAKYHVERRSGPTIEGRPTRLWLLSVGGRVREQLAVDEATGLVLHRALFAPSGTVTREVTVQRLDTGAGHGLERSEDATENRRRPVAVRHLPPLYRAPEVLAGGYRRVGAYHGDGHVHLVYSDGLHTMSLFVRPGRLSDLVEEGQPVQVGEARGLRYAWPGGEVVAWRSGPVVRLLVSDAPADEVLAAARSLPEADGLSWLARLRRACRRVAEVVSGGP